MMIQTRQAVDLASQDSRSTAVKHRSVYNVKNSWYVILAKVSTPYWQEVSSPVRKDVANFEKLTSAEARDLFSDKNLPYQGNPTVVSVSETEVYTAKNK